MHLTAARFRLITLAPVLLFAVPTNASTQAAVPRFEPLECFAQIRAWAARMGVECGWLVVPQLRDRPGGPTVRLPVARLRAVEPDGSPPLVYLHGGPGGAGALGTNARSVFEWPIARHRDVVVYDHRGAGLSEPRVCPEVALEIDRRRDNAEEDSQARWNGNARECVAAMRSQGIDPLAYTTYNNVLDLIDLRRTLGYERWDVYGVSYGGALAQEAMRHDGAAVRAAVLTYSTTTGPTMQVEAALSYQRSLEHLFESCAAQPECADAFASLEENFYGLYEEFQRNPVDVVVERSSGPTTIRVDGERYLRDMRCQLSSPRTVRRIPILVRELRGEARQRALELLVGGCGIGGAFNATIQLVICHAIHGDAYLRAARDVRRQVRPELRWMVGDNSECELWQERFADRSSHDFVKSDIPTLLVTGEFDERSPTSISRRIASSLSRSWLYELPGESHGGAVVGCHASILFQFLQQPTSEPDASCIAEMPRVVFETRTLQIPTFVLNITSSSGASTPLLGVWEAELPDAPQVVTFELDTDGASISGELRPQGIEVFDGAVDGSTLRFRVKSPDGQRTITFSGELRGEQLVFTRDVDVPAGAPGGGRWIFGSQGVRTFGATRAK